MKTNKTYMPRPSEIVHKCYVIDANNKILGRVAAKAAALLRGKHKATFTPHLDSGDMVVIVNAEKIRVTGKKMQDKIYQRYSGYPSGKKLLSLGQLLQKSPETVMRLAVSRMIPKGRLGYKVRGRLKVYSGETHPHQAQRPIPLEV